VNKLFFFHATLIFFDYEKFVNSQATAKIMSRVRNVYTEVYIMNS